MSRPVVKVEVLGMLDPQRMYTARGLMRHAGIGTNTQQQMRADGVKPIDIGNFRWYRGRDVIGWIEKHGG